MNSYVLSMSRKWVTENAAFSGPILSHYAASWGCLARNYVKQTFNFSSHEQAEY